MTVIPTMIIILLTIVALTPLLEGVYKTIQHLNKYKSSKRRMFLSACPLIAQFILAFYIFDVDHLLNPEILNSLYEPFDAIFIISPMIYVAFLLFNFAFFVLKNPELL